MKKVVLAYSGGLDTSYCAMYLSKDLGLEVYAVSVDMGGFSEEEKIEIENKAYQLGVKNYKNIDAKKAYYEKVIKYLIFGNVLKNNTYPLSVSAERIVQAIEIALYAKEMGADYIAQDRKSTRQDPGHVAISYAVFCLILNRPRPFHVPQTPPVTQC